MVMARTLVGVFEGERLKHTEWRRGGELRKCIKLLAMRLVCIKVGRAAGAGQSM